MHLQERIYKWNELVCCMTLSQIEVIYQNWGQLIHKEVTHGMIPSIGRKVWVHHIDNKDRHFKPCKVNLFSVKQLRDFHLHYEVVVARVTGLLVTMERTGGRKGVVRSQKCWKLSLNNELYPSGSHITHNSWEISGIPNYADYKHHSDSWGLLARDSVHGIVLKYSLKHSESVIFSW